MSAKRPSTAFDRVVANNLSGVSTEAIGIDEPSHELALIR